MCRIIRGLRLRTLSIFEYALSIQPPTGQEAICFYDFVGCEALWTVWPEVLENIGHVGTFISGPLFSGPSFSRAALLDKPSDRK